MDMVQIHEKDTCTTAKLPKEHNNTSDLKDIP